MGGLVSFTRSSLASAVMKSDAADFQLGKLPTLGGFVSAAGPVLTQATAMTISTVFACASIRSKDVSRCFPRLMREDGARSEKPIRNHYVAKLFRRPNWLQTWSEFALQMQLAYLLRGNAYAVILRNGSGVPVALIPINPDGVTILEAVDGSIFYQCTRFGLFQMAALRGLPIAIPEEDIFHLKGLTFNSLVGLSLISIARDSLGLTMGLEQQASLFMKQGARPSGVLQTDKVLSESAALRLRSQWEELRAGIKNAGRTAILEDGVKWEQMQLSSVDLEFIGQRQFGVSEVARWFDMPLWKLGVSQEMARIKFDDAQPNYVNSVIMPDLDLWEQKFIQKFDLDEEGLVADFDERRLLRAAEATRINNQRLKIMSGIATQNECRAENGDPPLPGGDVLLTPVNLASSGSDMSGTAPDGAGRPSGGQLPDPGAANDTKAARYLTMIRDVSGQIARLGPDKGYEVMKSIPNRLRELDAEYHSTGKDGVVTYHVKEQSQFVQETLSPASTETER